MAAITGELHPCTMVRNPRLCSPDRARVIFTRERLENNMLKGFRDFILRGNVVDLAVAVIIGAAFNAVVTSFTKDVLGQLIAALVGKPDFDNVVLMLNGTPIRIGTLLTAGVQFLIVAGVV